MAVSKVKINGVSINLDEVSKKSPEEIKALGIFDNDAEYEALGKEIDAYKAKEPEPVKVEVVKGKKRK